MIDPTLPNSTPLTQSLRASTSQSVSTQSRQSSDIQSTPANLESKHQSPTVTAKVISSTPISEPLRQRLIQLLNTDLQATIKTTNQTQEANPRLPQAQSAEQRRLSSEISRATNLLQLLQNSSKSSGSALYLVKVALAEQTQVLVSQRPAKPGNQIQLKPNSQHTNALTQSSATDKYSLSHSALNQTSQTNKSSSNQVPVDTTLKPPAVSTNQKLTNTVSAHKEQPSPLPITEKVSTPASSQYIDSERLTAAGQSSKYQKPPSHSASPSNSKQLSSQSTGNAHSYTVIVPNNLQTHRPGNRSGYEPSTAENTAEANDRLPPKTTSQLTQVLTNSLKSQLQGIGALLEQRSQPSSVLSHLLNTVSQQLSEAANSAHRTSQSPPPNDIKALTEILNTTTLLQTKMRQLSQSVPSLDTLSSPSHLEASIRNSGVFLEAKLAQLSSQLTPQVSNQRAPVLATAKQLSPSSGEVNVTRNPLAGDATSRTLSHSTFSHNRPSQGAFSQSSHSQSALSQSSLSQNTLSQSTLAVTQDSSDMSAAAKEVLQQDVKGQLLTIQVLIERLLSALPQDQHSTRRNDQALLNLLGLMFSVNKNSASSPRESLDQAKSEIRQLLNAVTRANKHIQQMQLVSLSRSGGPETPQLTVTTEIPIRLGDHIHPLLLHIQEQHESPNQDSREREHKEKSRKWHVKMAFESPEGCFHAHLNLINDTLKADLWLDSPPMLSKAKHQLNALKKDLENQGLTVSGLKCHEGVPPPANVGLQTSLVDVRT